MAINKKLIHFLKKSDFDTLLAAGNILDTSIVFIKDAKQIYTHGQLYNCPFTEDEIRSLLNNKADLSKLNDYLTKTDAAATYLPKGNYITSIPIANGTTAGIVKQGGDVTINNGVITVNDDSHNHIISNVDGLQSALDAKLGIISDLSTIRNNASKSVTALLSIEDSLKQCLQNNPQSFTSELKKLMLENLGIFILDSFISENIIENSLYGASYELGITEEDYNRVRLCTLLIVNAKGLITVFTERTSISDDYAPLFRALSTANIDSIRGIIRYGLTAYQEGSSNNYYVIFSVNLPDYASTYDLDKKLDIIPDLDYIRSYAFNALQSVPEASTSTAGIVKIGSNISVSSGTISLSKANVTAALGYTPPTAYTNMTASEATTGTATTGRVISAKVIHDKINEMLPTTLSEAKSYTDTKVSELVGLAPEALNTIYELAEAMATNQGAVDTLESAIGNKVDKVSGKGLSTNDYTTTEKNKLAGIASGAEVNVQSDWSVTDTTSDAYIKNKPSLAAVATSGKYSDLSGRPTVDSAISTSSTNAVQNKAITTAVNAKYTKPSTGIPSSDLSSDVLGSLAKANSALQSFTETDPVFTASAAASIKSSDITNWNSKTSNVGTITGIKMNGASKGTSGVVDLGTVITAHQDISGKVDKVSGKGLSTNDYTTTEKSKLAGIASGAEVNQNAFSNVKVGDVTVAADAKQDTLTLVAGNNVTITPDATNDTITIAAKDTTYSFSNGNPTLSWGKLSTIGTVGGVNLTVTMPANPNSDTHWTTGINAGKSGAVVNSAVTNPYVTVKDNSTYRSQIRLVGGGATTISSDASGNITINSTDTNTTYSAGNGISLSGTTFSHADTSSLSGSYGPTADVTGSNNATIVVPQITIDGYGHVTGVTNRTYTSKDTNTKYNVISTDELNTGTATISRTVTAKVLAPWVKNQIDSKLAANDAMLFKGTIGSSGATVTELPESHNAGWTYKVITAGTYAGQVCEIGDMIICITDGTAANDAHWTVVQTNVDGTVIGPASSTDAHVAVFNGTTGKVIKDSGFTIGKSVPSNAVFTDTNTKVTSVGNHYTPASDNSAKLTASASSSTAATWGSTDMVTGVTLTRDAKGHVTGLSVSSIQMPANPNSDTHYTTGINAGASGATSNSAVTNPYITVKDNSTYRSQIQLKGGGKTTVTSDSSGVVTINSTWRGITDSTSTTDSTTSASATAVKTAYDKAVSAYNLANGKTSNTGTVTSVATGKGLTGGTITGSGTIKCNLNSETSLGTIGTTSKLYAVGVDANNKLCVNVPWTDNNTTYKFTNKAATLAWNSAVTVATVGGTDITVKLPANPNSDTKVTQTVTTTNANYPLLFAPSGQTANTTTTSYFNTGIYANASTKSLYATNFYSTSDKQFKTNIESIITSDNCPKVRQFDWKDNGTHSYGFIAQELEEQGYKELVSTNEEDGSKTVNYSATLSLVVGKMQAKIEELEKKIAELEDKLTNKN